MTKTYYFVIIIISKKGGFIKNFLKKMPVMIVFVALAVIGLLVYIPMLARPVSYGMTYVYSHTVTEEESTSMGEAAGTEISMKIQIKSDEKADMTYSTNGVGEKLEVWIIRNGNQFILIPETMTEEEYNQLIDALKADEEAWNALWNDTEGQIPMFRINAFKITPADYLLESGFGEMICNDAIIFTVLWGVLEVALIVFASLSVVFFVKGKKTAPETTEEQTSNETAAE